MLCRRQVSLPLARNLGHDATEYGAKSRLAKPFQILRYNYKDRVRKGFLTPRVKAMCALLSQPKRLIYQDYVEMSLLSEVPLSSIIGGLTHSSS